MRNILRMSIIAFAFILECAGADGFAENLASCKTSPIMQAHRLCHNCHHKHCKRVQTGPTGPTGPTGNTGPMGTISQAFGKLSQSTAIQDYQFTGSPLPTLPPTSADYMYFVPFPFDTFNTNTANMTASPITGTMKVPNTGYYLINSALTFGSDFINNPDNAPNVVLTGLIITNLASVSTLITDNGGGYAPGGGNDSFFNPAVTVSFSELYYLNAGDQVTFGMAYQDTNQPYISIYSANGSIIQVGQ